MPIITGRETEAQRRRETNKTAKSNPKTRRASELPPQPDSGPSPDQLFSPGAPFAVRHALPPASSRQRPQAGRGRRSQTSATRQGGHYVRAAEPQGSARDIAIDATLRAAALRIAGKAEFSPLLSHPSAPVSEPGEGPPITPADLRVKIRRARTGNLILFVVDASGSMGARKRMAAVKGAILSLLLDAYQKRDRVGLITFRGNGARLLVSPTNSVEQAERQLRQLPTGGRTPLAAGLQLANQVLTNYLLRGSALAPLLVLVTDGRANIGSPAQLRQTAETLAQKQIAALVLDSEQGFVRLGKAGQLAGWLGAEYLPLDELRAESISRQVRRKLPP